MQGENAKKVVAEFKGRMSKKAEKVRNSRKKVLKKRRVIRKVYSKDAI